MLEILDTFRGSQDLTTVQVILVQEIICEPGVHHAENDHWQLVYGKEPGEFRGEGIAHTVAYRHHHSTVVPAAAITQIRAKHSPLVFTTVSGHIPHHATISATETLLEGWRRALSAQTTRRTVLGLDANETFSSPVVAGAGCYSHTGRGDAVLTWATSNGFTVPPQQLHLPSHHPYNTAMLPRRLDYIFTRHITAGEGTVIPCKDRAASDHDAIQPRHLGATQPATTTANQTAP